MATKQEPHDTRTASREELDRLLKLLAAQQRPVNGSLGKSEPVFLEGGMTEALAVFIAQQRAKRVHGGGAADPFSNQARAW